MSYLYPLTVEVVKGGSQFDYTLPSRTRDYVHNFSDINAGAAIGVSAAMIGYFINYPSLSQRDSDVPYSESSPEEQGSLQKRVSV